MTHRESRAFCLLIARQCVRMARIEIELPRTLSAQTEHLVRERVWLRVLDHLLLAERWRDRARAVPRDPG